jgi:TonB family protein
MFNTLQSDSAKRGSWWISLVLHGLVVTLLVVTPLAFPETLNVRRAPDRYNITNLIAPSPVTEPPKLTRLQLPAPVPKLRVESPPRELALRDPIITAMPTMPVMPAVEERKESTPPPPPVKLEIALPQPQPVTPPPAPREIITGVLPGKNPDTPPVNKPAREIQTGGFGDPNGARGEGRPDRAATIARLGSFGLPAGPGTGNGTGGARGSQGTVTNAGFGSGIVSGNNSAKSGASTAVQQGAFSDGRPDQTAAVRTAKPAGSAETPVEVLFKPRPEYTEEARKARDEGEVLVRVLFAATGNVRVIEVVKGLPHGLSESALRAAEQIRFKPATKDGRPVDSVAVVHINFQLAY